MRSLFHLPTSKFARRRAVVVAALIMVTISAAAFLAVGRADAIPEVGLGTPLRVGDFDYRVGAVRMADTIDFGAAERRAQGRFAIIELSVVNRGDAEQDLPSDVFRLVDDNGRDYTADPATNRLQNGSAWGVVTAPGVQRELLLAFDIAPDSAPRWLEVGSPDVDPRRVDPDEPYTPGGRIRLD